MLMMGRRHPHLIVPELQRCYALDIDDTILMRSLSEGDWRSCEKPDIWKGKTQESRIWEDPMSVRSCDSIEFEPFLINV